MTYEGQALIRALAAVSTRDMYEWPLLAQIVYSRRAEPTVVLVPLDDAPYLKEALKPDWRIEVAFGHDLDSVPRVTVSGILQVLRDDSPEAIRSQAVVASIQYLDSKKRFTLPVVITVAKERTGYWVRFEDLPARPGGNNLVELTDDLKPFRVCPGF